MLKGKSLLAVVPARGGSKGVPLKNIHPLAGKPLITHTAELIRACGCFDKTVVSTDEPRIAEVARTAGLDVPFLRPAEISGDRIGDWDVLAHALQETERLAGVQYDVVVMLQPTSPLRRVVDVHQTIERLLDGGWDAVWTVSATPLKYHPFKQLTIEDGGQLRLVDARGQGIIARQQLTPVYHRNGVAYAFTRRTVLEYRTLLPERATALVLDGEFVSIDTIADFADVESLMRRGEAPR
jgi:CMP-N-acetylneuraminic acid synthetase